MIAVRSLSQARIAGGCVSGRGAALPRSGWLASLVEQMEWSSQATCLTDAAVKK